MDPLHKIDSAISVASKDNGISVEGQQPAEGLPPSSHPESHLHHDHLQDEQHLDLAPSTKAPKEKEQEPRATTDSTLSRLEPTTAGPLPVSPTPQAATQSAAMENLVAPRDTANRSRSPRPEYIDQPSADWYQLQLRPPTPPTYAVDTGDDSSASTAPSPFVFTAGGHGGGGSSTSATEESAADEEEEGEREDNGADALTQAGTGAIDVDHEQLELESDPGYESDRASFASTSLSSSVRDYLFENGRRYHRFREGRYNFPNDEAEQDREDMKHACVKMLCQNQLYFAPIDEDNLQNVLDIGTGTGIWAIEFGDLFPSADVLGIDLSPIQPDWVPANVHFVVDDAESDWIYPPDHFDYIHTRHTVMAIKDWPKLYREAKE